MIALTVLEALFLGLLALAHYELVVSLFGFLPPRPSALIEPRHRFAFLIPAHNEEEVIALNVQSILGQHYPRELFDVFVIADNCTDGTALAARAAGAEVLERRDRLRKGKPAALNWGFAQLQERILGYDAICIVDADNLVPPNYLAVMNGRLARGERLIQAYLDTKNPDDSWIAGSIALAYWSTSRIFQLARARLGLCSALGGTGMCIATELLARYGWSEDCLTEDLEFQVRALLDGQRTTWAHDTRTYDEKPLTLRQSWRQRLRWMRGHIRVAWQHGPRLLALGLRQGSWAKLDAFLYLVQPLRLILAFVILSAIGALRLALAHPAGALVPPGLLSAFGLTYLVYLAQFQAFGCGVIALLLERPPWRAWRYYFHSLLFGLTWVPIVAQALLTLGQRQWVRTEHRSRMEIATRLAWAEGGRASPIPGPGETAVEAPASADLTVTAGEVGR
jgi:cellulose synthase/poly-beta-1,6-N-acetylglucosamine synthase-like glycosyltransferase